MKLSRSLLRREISNLQPQRILFTRSEADSRICILHSMVGDSSAGKYSLRRLASNSMLFLKEKQTDSYKEQTSGYQCGERQYRDWGLFLKGLLWDYMKSCM